MSSRSQSAVEYLTTYGWAIVAVAVALGVLYSLGVFGQASNGSMGCSTIQGFSCSKPILYSSGIMSLGLGQIGQGLVTVTATGCSQNNTAPTNWFGTTGQVLQSGQIQNLTFACPGVQSTLGSVYTGTLWIQYTNNANGNSGTSAVPATIQVAVIKTIVQPPLQNPPYVYVINGIAPQGYINVINYITGQTVSAIPMGMGTYSTGPMAFNPAGTLAYITTLSGVIVVNTVTASITTPIPLSTCVSAGGTPGGVAFDPSGTFAYVTCTASGVYQGVSIISVASSSIVGSVSGAVGYGTMGVAFNPSTLTAYVASYTGGSIDQINTATNTVAHYISLGGSAKPSIVIYTPSGANALIGSGNNFGLYGMMTAGIMGGAFVSPNTPPYTLSSMALNPSGTVLYEISGTTLTEINATTYATMGSLTVVGGGYTLKAVGFSPAGNIAYVLSQANSGGAGTISIINPATFSVMQTISTVSYPSGVMFLPPT